VDEVDAAAPLPVAEDAAPEGSVPEHVRLTNSLQNTLHFQWVQRDSADQYCVCKELW
jgi:hypothetical protein